MWKHILFICILLGVSEICEGRVNSCTFEHSWCIWHAETRGNYEWKRHRGRTETAKTGPTVDRTTGYDGYYLYAEASPPASHNDVAILKSLEFPPTSGLCMYFNYYMYGKTMGELSAHLIQLDLPGTPNKTLWTASGDKGDKWHYARAQIKSINSRFYVEFVAKKGPGELSDMALDDIFFIKGFCNPAPCKTSFKKIGCFREGVNAYRIYPSLLLNRETIDWVNYLAWLNKQTCRCAELAKKDGYSYFGIQYYGECWSGPSVDYARYGSSDQCVGVDYQECQEKDPKECTGKGFSSYIYKV